MKPNDDLDRLTVPELVARYADVFGKPPRSRHKRWLVKRIAWRLEERRLGGLSKVAKRRLEELIAEIKLPLDDTARAMPAPKPRGPAVGTALVREWRGREIRVNVVDGGFEHDGTVYRSLSAVAKAITGSHWNGKLFFGLTKREKAS